MMKDLTIKQKMVLECLNWYIQEFGFSPTFKELSVLLHSDVASVFQKVMILEERGYVSQVNGKQRTLRVIKYD